MVNLKAKIRVKTKNGLYPVYIRFTKQNQVSYVKTSWVVTEKGLNNKKEIIDPFVIQQAVYETSFALYHSKQIIRGNPCNPCLKNTYTNTSSC